VKLLGGHQTFVRGDFGRQLGIGHAHLILDKICYHGIVNS
jgi:hypothetical protein